jgi:hypothetical protein
MYPVPSTRYWNVDTPIKFTSNLLPNIHFLSPKLTLHFRFTNLLVRRHTCYMSCQFQPREFLQYFINFFIIIIIYLTTIGF